MAEKVPVFLLKKCPFFAVFFLKMSLLLYTDIPLYPTDSALTRNFCFVQFLESQEHMDPILDREHTIGVRIRNP